MKQHRQITSETMLHKIDSHIWMIDEFHDIIHDEDGDGFYIEKVIEEGISRDIKVSVKTYRSLNEALKAFRNNEVIYKY